MGVATMVPHRWSQCEPRRDQLQQSHPHGCAGMSSSAGMAVFGVGSCTYPPGCVCTSATTRRPSRRHLSHTESMRAPSNRMIPWSAFGSMSSYGLRSIHGKSVRSKMHNKVLLAVVIGACLLTLPAAAFGQSAPFGFSWGPVDNVPRPSFATRDNTVTRLVYRRDRLPPNELHDTEEIFLAVCKNEGLQQIVWISRFLSASEEHDKVHAILAEGMRRYGEAEISEQGIVNWSAGRTVLARTSDEQGLHRIVMVSTGPGHDTCSNVMGVPPALPGWQ
jgi:hypothetical protein